MQDIQQGFESIKALTAMLLFISFAYWFLIFILERNKIKYNKRMASNKPKAFIQPKKNVYASRR